MTTTTPSIDAADALTARDRAARADRGFGWLALGAGLLVLVILAAIALATTSKAWPAFQEAGLDFIFSDTWNPAKGEFGGLAFIYGSVVVSSIALVLAVPVSIGIALFVTEVAPRRARSTTLTVLDLLAAIPSVVY